MVNQYGSFSEELLLIAGEELSYEELRAERYSQQKQHEMKGAFTDCRTFTVHWVFIDAFTDCRQEDFRFSCSADVSFVFFRKDETSEGGGGAAGSGAGGEEEALKAPSKSEGISRGSEWYH